MQGRLDDVRKLYPTGNFYPGRVQSPQKMWEKRKKDSGKRLLFVIARVVGSNVGWRQILPAEFQQVCLTGAGKILQSRGWFLLLNGWCNAQTNSVSSCIFNFSFL